MSATHHSEWREFIRRSRHIATHIGFVPEEKGTVCELFVDSGNHRGESLSRSHKIALYVGAGQVAKLKQSYDSRRHEDHTSDDQQRGSYEAHFIEWSGQVIELSDAVSRICQQFDVVLTLRNLSCNMRTESEMRRMVEWISVHLKPGGTWVGSMADSSAIWKLLNKAPVTSLLCRDKNFIIDVKTAEIKHYGTDFEFTAPDGSKTHEYLVHLPSLLRTARGFDLHLLEFTSINDLLAEHSKALGLSTIEPSHPCWTALSLFGVFAFEKLEA